MANNHQQFIDFNSNIKLSETKKEELRKNREELRSKIVKYFKDNKPNEVAPSFHAQGSFMMHTTINPIPYEEEDSNGNIKLLYPYDLDDGVYFIDELNNRKTESIYHRWILDAVKDHTTKGANDKDTCVRVLYADGHNIDLPIYFEEKNKEDVIPQLAHKSKGFTDSDPIKFYQWFNDIANDQLKRIVRYLKAWKDKQDETYSTKMPSGMVLTILATNNYYEDNRDDIALKNTLQSIKDTLDDKFVCYRPTVRTDEDLLSKYNEYHFKDRLSRFLDSAINAVSNDSQKEACKQWQKYLGDRFSCKNIEEEDLSTAKSYSNPAIINTNAQSA